MSDHPAAAHLAQHVRSATATRVALSIHRKMLARLLPRTRLVLLSAGVLSLAAGLYTALQQLTAP